jgi:hypothetical protein
MVESVSKAIIHLNHIVGLLIENPRKDRVSTRTQPGRQVGRKRY